jgi:adenylate kinase family enzyme
METRIVIIGNAGTGKSTLAKKMARERGVSHFDLDSIAWDSKNGIDRRPLDESLRELQDFIDSRSEWVIEGCHMSLVQPVMHHCSELIFLNPGVVQSELNCRARPFEPHKFPSAEAQQENLEALIEWMKSYETRDDEFSLAAHRALFDSFSGPKAEYLNMLDYPLRSVSAS